jgi:Tfp pilus assembly PilM family ATPase
LVLGIPRQGVPGFSFFLWFSLFSTHSEVIPLLKEKLSSLFSGGGRSASSFYGIDFGQRRLKVVGVRPGSQGEPVVTDVVDAVVPPGIFENGVLSNVDDASKFLSKAISSSGIRTRALAISTGVLDGSVRRMRVPKQDRPGILRGLAVNPTMRIAGVESSSVQYDYHEIEPHGDEIDVVAAAALGDSVRLYQMAVQMAGFNTTFVSLPAIAMLNGFSVGSASKGRSVLLLVGHSHALITIIDDGVIQSTHSAMLGMEYLVDRVRSRNGGLSASAIEDAVSTGDLDFVGIPVIEDWIQRLSVEVRRSIGSILREDDEAGDSFDVFVMGGMARVPSFETKLNEYLNVSVRVFDPVSDFVREDVFGPATAVAYGLAVEAMTLSRKVVS